MRRFKTVTLACILLAACAQAPQRGEHGKSLGPCRITFDHIGDTWYAMVDRSPDDPGYASGDFMADIAVFVTNKGGTSPVSLTAAPTELQIPIPSYSTIAGAAPSSCQAFEPAAVGVSNK
jgi:hypothetical protein